MQMRMLRDMVSDPDASFSAKVYKQLIQKHDGSVDEFKQAAAKSFGTVLESNQAAAKSSGKVFGEKKFLSYICVNFTKKSPLTH